MLRLAVGEYLHYMNDPNWIVKVTGFRIMEGDSFVEMSDLEYLDLVAIYGADSLQATQVYNQFLAGENMIVASYLVSYKDAAPWDKYKLSGGKPAKVIKSDLPKN